MGEHDKNITKILSEVHNGVEGAADRLLPVVYDELRGIAGASSHPVNQTAVPSSQHEFQGRLRWAQNCRTL